MKRILFSLLTLTAASVWAQPVMNGIEISVTEKYKAQVAEGIKITGQPNVMDTTVEKLPVAISVRNRTWVPEPRMEAIPPLKISRTKLERLPANTVHMALGNYATADVGFALGNARSDLQRWGVQGQHFSTQGGFKANDATGNPLNVYNRTTWMENSLSGQYARIIGRGRLSTEASADWNRYAFYGMPLTASNAADTAASAPGRWTQDYQVGLSYLQSRIRRKQVFHGAELTGHHWIDQGGRQVESGLAGGIDWRLPVQDVFLELPISRILEPPHANGEYGQPRPARGPRGLLVCAVFTSGIGQCGVHLLPCGFKCHFHGTRKRLGQALLAPRGAFRVSSGQAGVEFVRGSRRFSRQWGYARSG